jgi:hypothetical protein
VIRFSTARAVPMPTRLFVPRRRPCRARTTKPPLQTQISNYDARDLCKRWRALSFSPVARTSNAPENSLEAIRQCFRLKRLAEKAGRPAGHRFLLGAGFGASGDHDHRQ